jgi:hypothetical protein
MPKFLDVHPMKGFDEETLRNGPCLLDAPNKEAIEKHHATFGLKCEWITEVETTA